MPDVTLRGEIHRDWANVFPRETGMMDCPMEGHKGENAKQIYGAGAVWGWVKLSSRRFFIRGMIASSDQFFRIIAHGGISEMKAMMGIRAVSSGDTAD